MRIARRGIVVVNLTAALVKCFSDSQADCAEPNDANDQAIESGKIIGEHARAKFTVVAGANLRIGPCEATQQNGCGGDDVFGDGAIATAGNIRYGNAEPL